MEAVLGTILACTAKWPSIVGMVLSVVGGVIVGLRVRIVADAFATV